MNNDNANIIDDSRTRCLCDVGLDDYIAATAVAADGSAHLVLARCDALGDENALYDPTCSAVRHEQTGPLPPGVQYRVSQVVGLRGSEDRDGLRCGRPTKSGTRCRIPVHQPGDACVWHRTEMAS
jgi:hypothetical protein